MLFRTITFLLLFVFTLFSSISFADSTQDRRVTISASIFPRIIAVDKDIEKKVDDSGNVRLGLLYHTNINKAKQIKNLILRKVKRIAGKKVVVQLVPIGKVSLENSQKLSGIFFVQPVSKKLLVEVTTYTQKHKILSFSPFEGDIERGVMASIFVGAKIQPYFNLKSIESANLVLKPALLRVSKIYE